jgi:hypothetical protein
MSYSEMQFIKAEAALRKGDRVTAYTAYINGISAHFDFVNLNNVGVANFLPISTTERNRYLASAAVKQNAAALNLTDIMQQKFIANWGWNFIEQWSDMRRFHYYDVDLQRGCQYSMDFKPSPFFLPLMVVRTWLTGYGQRTFLSSTGTGKR